MKLWTIPLAKLIHVEESEDLEFSPQKQETLNFQKFKKNLRNKKCVTTIWLG